jgi:acetate kinase
MKSAVVVLNVGSSSVKFSVFRVEGEELHRSFRGAYEAIGTAPSFSVEDGRGETIEERRFTTAELGGQEAALQHLLGWLSEHNTGYEVTAVGHRVVHGGPRYSAPVLVNKEVLCALAEFEPLAPLHQPHNLAPIRQILEMRPELPQVACFDTAFHRTMPLVAELYALPQEMHAAGIRRYGFHGLSYEYIVRALTNLDPAAAAGRLVVAHLGNGCSMAAIRGGKSVACTMGFTALDGLPMGTRCGQIDPGVLLYLMRSKGMDVSQLEDLLYHRSGLKGLSGISSDMRTLLSSQAAGAKLAIDHFVYRVGRDLGSLAAALGGLDALVFTGGIGEHAADVRARVCRDAAWLQVTLDEEANRCGDLRISKSAASPSVWVIPTDEELMIARHTVSLLASAPLLKNIGSSQPVA